MGFKYVTHITDDLVFIQDKMTGYRQAIQLGDLGLYSTYVVNRQSSVKLFEPLIYDSAVKLSE